MKSLKVGRSSSLNFDLQTKNTTSVTDYRYYEDPSDEFRDEEGTLLPLWKFTYEKTKKMNVTDMCFNTLYYDLFAVCFGSRNIERP